MGLATFLNLTGTRFIRVGERGRERRDNDAVFKAWTGLLENTSWYPKVIKRKNYLLSLLSN